MYQMVEGCDAMIICTSAVPKLVYMSLLPLVFRRCLGYPSGKPEFFYEEGATPEEVRGETEFVADREEREAVRRPPLRTFGPTGRGAPSWGAWGRLAGLRSGEGREEGWTCSDGSGRCRFGFLSESWSSGRVSKACWVFWESVVPCSETPSVAGRRLRSLYRLVGSARKRACGSFG